jgi:hypothetical protein
VFIHTHIGISDKGNEQVHHHEGNRECPAHENEHLNVCVEGVVREVLENHQPYILIGLLFMVVDALITFTKGLVFWAVVYGLDICVHETLVE